MSEIRKILRVEYDIPWLAKPHEGRMVLADQLPPRDLINTALVLAFAGERILMTKLVKRGWDIPGGHVEAGEWPEETVRREVDEETGATLGSLQLLGYQHLKLLGTRPEGYRYPYPESYQVFYYAQVEEMKEFVATDETLGPAFFAAPEARKLAWVQRNGELYEAALEMIIS